MTASAADLSDAAGEIAVGVYQYAVAAMAALDNAGPHDDGDLTGRVGQVGSRGGHGGTERSWGSWKPSLEPVADC